MNTAWFEVRTVNIHVKKKMAKSLKHALLGYGELSSQPHYLICSRSDLHGTKPLSSQMGSGFNNYVNVYLLNSQNRLHLKRRVRFSMKCFGIYVYQGRAKRVVGSPVTTKTKTR